MANLDKSYQEFLADLKSKIASTRYTAARAVNTEFILLYWDIGNSILQKQGTVGWGKKVIQQLSKDLGGAFPDMKGFSERNLDFMRHFAKLWPDSLITKQLVSKLPWGHNILLLQKISNESDRL